jgi:hypothetical protein
VQITFLETSHAGLLGGIPRMGGNGVCVIMPSTDLGQAVNSARRMIAFAEAQLHVAIVEDVLRQGFVKTLNQAAAAINPAFVAYVAQDALAGKSWLKIAVERLVVGNKSLCAFNDGVFGGRIAQFGLVRTSFAYAHYGEGNIFFPGYHTHRADDELSLIAKQHDQYVYAPDALLMEIDYRLKRAENRPDVELFAKRSALYEGKVASPG